MMSFHSSKIHPVSVRPVIRALLLMAMLLTHVTSSAEGEFETDSAAFIEAAFDGSIPATGTIWLTGEVQQAAAEILGRRPHFLRVRYWDDDQRSAWIIDEIGKTEPITFGVVISDSKIEQARVLAFRESRGWEIRHDFFTRQFLGLGLNDQHQLSGNIDGISGATLSVRAMNKVTRLALYLAGTLEGKFGVAAD